MTQRKKTKKLFKLLAATLSEKGHRILLHTSIVFSLLIFSISLLLFVYHNPSSNVLGSHSSQLKILAKSILISPTTTNLPTPTLAYTPTPTIPPPTPTKRIIPKPTPTLVPAMQSEGTNPSQYTAQKVNDVTWRVSNIQNDDKMANKYEVFNALNAYRTEHGLSFLSWDTKLADFAQGRADTFAKNGSLDAHAGFTNYMNNGGFDASGFNGLGENSAFIAGPMNGDKIIRSIFGADPSHDGNQLNPSWTHAGIGVNGNAINVNFGKNKK